MKTVIGNHLKMHLPQLSVNRHRGFTPRYWIAANSRISLTRMWISTNFRVDLF